MTNKSKPIVVMNSSRKPALFLLLLATLITFATSACNTTEGLGKDIEKAGDKIQEKAAR